MNERLDAVSFKSLTITREVYGSDKGKLVARIMTTFYNNALEIVVDHAVATEILKLCMPHIATEVTKTLIDVQRDAESFMIAQVDDSTDEPKTPSSMSDDVPF